MDADKQPEKRENILDILAEAEAIGDGDKSHLEARVENMNRHFTERNTSYIQPLSAEEIAEQQQKERDQQIEAAARGERPALSGGQAPRISDFYLIDTTMSPEDFVKMLNHEVLGNYEVQDHQGEAEFGMIVMRHRQGVAQARALPAGASGTEITVPARDMLIVKLDAGPWPWYDAASIAILTAIVKAVGRKAWRCGWAIDKQWSWVEHWRVDKKTHQGKMTETIDGPANATVTEKARARWNVDIRAAFDDLMLAAQWEALRQWLITPDRPTPFTAHVSFQAGKLLVHEKDREWIEPKWKELFPGRKPEDGPLHLQSYYVPIKASKPIPEKEKVQSFRTEPPLLEH